MSDSFDKSSTIRVKPTNDGLHLDDSILWFDSHTNGQLSFLSSSLDSEKINVPQVITTEETARILEVFRRRPNALICQYNRPFSIGILRMELLPSGCVLGGASLHVETEAGKLLYAPRLQIHRIPTVRQMQLKKAKSLVLGAFHPSPETPLPNRKKEREALLSAVADSIARDQWPTIACAPVGTAQEITKLLTDANIPVMVSPLISKVNRVYESYGSPLGSYSVHTPRRAKSKVAIFPLPSAKLARFPAAPDGPLIVVKDSVVEHEFESIDRSIASFVLSSHCDGIETREVIAAVQPKELYFFGPYAKAYLQAFANLAPSVKPLYTNDQPTLF